MATPIGNLEDITLRALRVLREVALIAAEDTRRTQHLLHYFEITTPTISYHDHSPPSRTDYLLEKLEGGESVALVTDAGTPGISDPGYVLTTRAIAAGIPVVPVPGPSAVLAALTASGLPASPFLFQGFLPRQRSARAGVLQRLRRESCTLVLFEAPHRLHATLTELEAVLGPRPVAVARELTKRFEEIWRGTLPEAAARWQEGVRGEFVLVIGPPIEGSGGTEAGPDTLAAGAVPPLHAAVERVAALVAEGMSRRDAARQAAEEMGLPYREVYRRALDDTR